MKKSDLKKRILLSITGKKDTEWKKKLKEINKLKIREVGLFLSQFDKKQRQNIYQELLRSKIKYIPFVHSRHDMTLEEYEFLIKKFGTKYFSIHEENFPLKKELKPIHKKMVLEMNFDDKLNKKVDMKKIAGFCVDLSHFKASQDRKTKDFKFILENKNKTKFLCSHLNGYSFKNKIDIHKPRNLNQFEYLKKLPKFIFGRYIALEMQVSIKKQIEFKKHIIKVLSKKN